MFVTKPATWKEFIKEELKAGDEKFEIGLTAGLSGFSVSAENLFGCFIWQ